MKRLLFLFALLSCYNILLFGQSPNWALYGVEGYHGFHNGVAIARKRIGDTRKFKYGTINTSGQTVIDFKYDDLSSYGDFSSGYCVFTIDGKCGIVDIFGNEVIPANDDYKISNNDKHNDVFVVKSKSKEKLALFYAGRFVTGFKYDYCFDYNYPFISLSSKDISGDTYYNVTTGDILKGYTVISWGNHITVSNKKEKFYYDKEGERIKNEDLIYSSKGLYAYQDSITKLWGLKSRHTGKYVVNPKFPDCKERWYKDYIVMLDYGSDVILDADGKEIFSELGKPLEVHFYENAIIYQQDILDYESRGLLSYDGKILNKCQKTKVCIPLLADYWKYDNKLINVKTGKSIIVDNACEVGEMIKYETNGKYYLLNPITDKTYGPFPNGLIEYGDGIYTIDYGAYLIDKNGRTYYKGADLKFSYPSEDVICTWDMTNNVYGYIYNPTQNTHRKYNQKEYAFDKYAINRLMDEAYSYTQKGKYGKAKDIYYQVFMADRKNYAALNNYGSCLYNLGYLEEALSIFEMVKDLNPEYENIEKHISIAKNAISERDAAQNEEVAEIPAQNSGNLSFWDALATIGNVLSGGTATAYVPQSDYYNSDENYSSSSSVKSGDNSYYQTQYDRLARRAESAYRSLTNLGVSVTNKNGEKKGSALGTWGVTSGTGMKMELRKAQSEMKKLRQEAQRKGITIITSQYETAEVSL